MTWFLAKLTIQVKSEMKILQQWINKALIVVLLTVGSVISAHSSSLQSHKSITYAVKQFVMQQNVPLENLHVTLTSLSDRLVLPKCGKSLQISMAPGTKLQGNTSLAVSCASPEKWKIHVAAHIDGQVNVLIARHPIPRGTIIQNEDMEFVLRRYSQLSYGYYGSAKLLTNMEAKRNIKTGQVLTPNLVKAQKMVLRGEHITIIAQNGGLNLRVKGKALMDGKMGQMIKVKNLNSKKLIYARVISAGIVKVNF